MDVLSKHYGCDIPDSRGGSGVHKGGHEGIYYGGVFLKGFKLLVCGVCLSVERG